MQTARRYDTRMRRVVDGCYLLAAGALAPIVVYRACRTGKYRTDWRERRGFLPDLAPSQRRVWVHAVSVGEVNAARGVIDVWRKQDPQTEFVISTTTDTGLARARQIFPGMRVVRYPLDFSWFVARALDRIKPNLIVLVELELWYQFVTMAAERKIPVAVINGRLSARSVQRFRWVRPIVRRMFECLAWVGAQDEVYAERFRYMGVPAERVSVTGSVKWDGAEVADTIPGSDALARAMGVRCDQPVWVAGSTGPGEEAIILDAFQRLRERHPGLQLVIVPRKPERFDEVADLIRKAGFACVRRSERPDTDADVGGETPPPPPHSAATVFLGDTMGELRKFYCMASVVLVGRSLADMGGSDTMEVAALAKPIIVGPHNDNFADTIAQLQQGQAVRILSADVDDARAAAHELAEVADEILSDPAAARAMGQRGRQVVLANRGATQRTIDVLMEMLNRAQHRAS